MHNICVAILCRVYGCAQSHTFLYAPSRLPHAPCLARIYCTKISFSSLVFAGLTAFAFRCRAAATFGHLRLSKLPQVFLALLELLATFQKNSTPSFSVQYLRRNTLSCLRSPSVTYVIVCSRRDDTRPPRLARIYCTKISFPSLVFADLTAFASRCRAVLSSFRGACHFDQARL